MRLVVPVWCVVCVFAFGAAPPRQPVVDTPPARQPAADTQPAREPAADTPAEPKRETPPPRIVIIEGQVTDAVGAGHTGVTVTVRRKGADGHDGELIATTTTGEYGDFAVTADRPVSGDVVVTFTAEAYAPLVHELSLTPGADVPFLGEELEGNVVVIGRVIDGRTKDPVAGVAVTLDAAERDWDATTDAKGRFTIKGAFPGRGLLIAEADGYGREREPVERLEDFGEIILTIKPERIVHVRVVDDAGRAIRGVTVECYDRPRDDFRTYVSDDQGVVTMRRVHFDAASLLLRLTHPQHVSSVGFDKTLRLPAGEIESSHTITLPRAGRITGTVVDARSGETLYGARLVTGDAYADDTPRDWSDFEGHFAIEGVAPGQVTVTVHLA
ncbi:MAG: carboxypeptidase regulatory-like domain-containing protein, partial [Phycisphaerae bacterium]